MIYVLGPKDKKLNIPTFNVTTSSKTWTRKFSPMLLGPIQIYGGFLSQNVENAWQFSKVYKEFTNASGNPTPEYFKWANKGFEDDFAHRYPNGKGAVPQYSLWGSEKLGYIEARKRIYLPLYKEAVKKHAYQEYLDIKRFYQENGDIALWDFDGYNHIALDMTLEDVLNDPARKMGHAFVLAMMLENNE
jgi:hypothetical protein